MEEQNQQNKIIAWIGWAVLAMSGCLTAVYWACGHAWVQAVYEGRSVHFLRPLIARQKDFSLEVYFRTADATVIAMLIIALLAFVFLWVCVHVKGNGQERWLFAGPFVFFIVAAANFLPALSENEWVYLIFPRRLLNPAFLAFDWTWQGGQYEHFIFDCLISPFTLIMNDLCLALTGRVVTWFLLISAFMKLAQALGMSWRQFVLAFAFWFYAGQSMAAGEWIFGGFEAKCLSYVFVFWALTSVLKDNFIKAGLFAGMAVSFHVVVGSWAVIGLTAPVLLSENARRVRNLVFFLGLSLLIGLPGLVPAVLNTFRNGPMANEHLVTSVLFRGPHHKDPFYFLTAGAAWKLVAAYGLAIFLMGRAFEKGAARKLIALLTVLMLVFGAGLIARSSNVFSFLCLFPFRLGPVFLLILLSLALFRILRNAGQSILLFEKLLAVAVLAFGIIHYHMPAKILKQTRGAVFVWSQYLAGDNSAGFLHAARWIDKNLPDNAVLIAPPWELRFWLAAKRAQVVSFKYPPPNSAITEWRQRLVSLNAGQEFKNHGNGAIMEMKVHYPDLSAAQLLEIKRRFGAGYYLNIRARDDLPFRLAYSNGTYYLYSLEDSGIIS